MCASLAEQQESLRGRQDRACHKLLEDSQAIVRVRFTPDNLCLGMLADTMSNRQEVLDMSVQLQQLEGDFVRQHQQLLVSEQELVECLYGASHDSYHRRIKDMAEADADAGGRHHTVLHSHLITHPSSLHGFYSLHRLTTYAFVHRRKQLE